MAESKHQDILVQPPRWSTNSPSKLEEVILVFMGGTNRKTTFSVFCSLSSYLGEICTVSIPFPLMVLCDNSIIWFSVLKPHCWLLAYDNPFSTPKSVALQLILLHLCPGTRTPLCENQHVHSLSLDWSLLQYLDTFCVVLKMTDHKQSIDFEQGVPKRGWC